MPLNASFKISTFRLVKCLFKKIFELRNCMYYIFRKRIKKEKEELLFNFFCEVCFLLIIAIQ